MSDHDNSSKNPPTDDNDSTRSFFKSRDIENEFASFSDQDRSAHDGGNPTFDLPQPNLHLAAQHNPFLQTTMDTHSESFRRGFESVRTDRFQGLRPITNDDHPETNDNAHSAAPFATSIKKIENQSVPDLFDSSRIESTLILPGRSTAQFDPEEPNSSPQPGAVPPGATLELAAIRLTDPHSHPTDQPQGQYAGPQLGRHFDDSDFSGETEIVMKRASFSIPDVMPEDSYVENPFSVTQPGRARIHTLQTHAIRREDEPQHTLKQVTTGDFEEDDPLASLISNTLNQESGRPSHESMILDSLSFLGLDKDIDHLYGENESPPDEEPKTPEPDRQESLEQELQNLLDPQEFNDPQTLQEAQQLKEELNEPLHETNAESPSPAVDPELLAKRRARPSWVELPSVALLTEEAESAEKSSQAAASEAHSEQKSQVEYSRTSQLGLGESPQLKPIPRDNNGEGPTVSTIFRRSKIYEKIKGNSSAPFTVAEGLPEETVESILSKQLAQPMLEEYNSSARLNSSASYGSSAAFLDPELCERTSDSGIAIHPIELARQAKLASEAEQYGVPLTPSPALRPANPTPSPVAQTPHPVAQQPTPLPTAQPEPYPESSLYARSSVPWANRATSPDAIDFQDATKTVVVVKKPRKKNITELTQTNRFEKVSADIISPSLDESRKRIKEAAAAPTTKPTASLDFSSPQLEHEPMYRLSGRRNYRRKEETSFKKIVWRTLIAGLLLLLAISITLIILGKHFP